MALSVLTLTACSGSPTPTPNPGPTRNSVDARGDFVGTWGMDRNNVISLRDDGSFYQLDCNTTGGTWNFRKSDQTIALAYKMGTALGCESSDFERARTGFLRGHTLVLKNTFVGDVKLDQQFELTKK